MTDQESKVPTPLKSFKVSRRTLWILGAFSLLIFSCVCSSVFNVTRLMSRALSGVGIEGVDISIYAPVNVKRGEIFDLEITVKNESDEAQSIDSIGFAEGYLDGIELISTQPRFYDRERLEILGMDFDTFIFLEVVRPGETVVIKIESRAFKSGDFGGQVGICISDIGACEMLVVRTVVED